MKTLVRPTRQFEFCFPNLDTLVLVEESDNEVVIRATRNAFSEQRKIHFIQQLAAEGFISDSYKWFSDFRSAKWLPLQWLVDYSWLKPNGAQAARTRCFMIRLLACAGLLWLGLMIALLVD